MFVLRTGPNNVPAADDTITIKAAGTEDTVSIYEIDGITPLANPFTVPEGQWGFVTADDVAIDVYWDDKAENLMTGIKVKPEKGDTGEAGPGVPAGGAAKEMLRKLSSDDYDSEWSPDVQYRIANSLFEDNGDLGEAKTFDYSNKTNHRGKMTEAIDITITGLSDGQRVGLHIYPGDAYETVLSITSWTGVDKWLGGSVPTEGPEVDGLLGLTFLNDGVNTIGMAAQEEV